MGWDGFPLPLWWASQLPSCLGRDGGPPKQQHNYNCPAQVWTNSTTAPLEVWTKAIPVIECQLGPMAHGTTKAITGTSININTFATLSLLLPPAIDDEGTATH